MAEESWDHNDVQKRKLHERYILFILLSLLVGVLTVKWSDVPKLTEYIAFALTLASMILAVMAIWYSGFSNQGLEKNLVSLVSSIGEVKQIASSLSASSTTLSREIQVVSERTGGMDLRLTQMAENTRVQEKAKEAIQPAPNVDDVELPKPDETKLKDAAVTGIDLMVFTESTSISGRHVLFALTIAFLNQKTLDMKSLFADDYSYRYGFLIALSSADVYVGSSDFNAVSVEQFTGADEPYLTRIVLLNQASAARSKVKSLPTSLMKDYGHMRAYFEENGFELYGSLDGFRKLDREEDLEPTNLQKADI